jgi:predicted CopG family antitoxin
MHDSGMGQRTISVPADVHELLSAQRRPGESFGDLLRRRMRPPAETCGDILDRLEASPLQSVDLKRLTSFRKVRGPRSPQSAPWA